MSMKRSLRVAAAGLGYWGPNIARNLAAFPDGDRVSLEPLQRSLDGARSEGLARAVAL